LGDRRAVKNDRLGLREGLGSCDRRAFVKSNTQHLHRLVEGQVERDLALGALAASEVVESALIELAGRRVLIGDDGGQINTIDIQINARLPERVDVPMLGADGYSTRIASDVASVRKRKARR